MKRLFSFLLIAATAFSSIFTCITAFAESDGAVTLTSITYNVNTDDESVITPEPTVVEYGGRAVIADAPVRQGYTMSGWNTSKTGNGVTFEPGETIYLSSWLTLYAMWEKTEAASDTAAFAESDGAVTLTSITYNVNTDDESVITPEPTVVEYGGRAVIADAPVRQGYTMSGWSTSKTGNGVTFEPGETIYLSSWLTLYAMWEKVEAASDTAGTSAPVAEMYICASAEDITGHVWLYFENICGHDIKVGSVTLKPGETTSVGSIGSTGTNVRAASMSMELNEAQLETVSAKITAGNSGGTLFVSRSLFALSVWNSVSDKKVVYIVLPVFTMAEILLCGGRFGTV